MLSWRLWRNLRTKDASGPLYRRILGRPRGQMPFAVTCALVIFGSMLIAPAVLFLSAFYGLRWATVIAGTIGRERQAGNYELLALSPVGGLGACRTILTACVDRDNSWSQLHSIGFWILRLGIILLATLPIHVATMADLREIPPDTATFMNVLYIASLVLIIAVDHLQSVALSGLVGMWIPHHVPRTLDAAIAAFALYLGLQVGTYGLTLYLGFTALPAALSSLSLAPEVSVLFLVGGRFLVFAISREVIVWLAWRRLIVDTSAAPSEIGFMTR